MEPMPPGLFNESRKLGVGSLFLTSIVVIINKSSYIAQGKLVKHIHQLFY